MTTIRGFRPGDEDGIRTVMEASFDVDRMPGWVHADIAKAIARLAVDPIGLVVADDGGAIVGYCIPRNDDLTVHPAYRRRGIGRRLVAAADELVRSRAAGPLRLHVATHLPPSVAFARALGFHYESSLWLFVLPVDVAVPGPVFPPSVTVRTWRDDEDLEAFVPFANASFEGHPTPLGLTVEFVRRVSALDEFDRSGNLLVAPADEPDRLIAFTKVQVQPDDAGRSTGWIGQIGVLPAWRGRGLGRELLRWGVDYLRGSGADLVELAVEATNERALGLYRRTGFEPAVEWPHWILDA